MYTFQAVADISTTHSHEGFIVIAVICAIIVVLSMLLSDDIDEVRGFGIFAAVVLTIAALVSWNTGEEVHYANKQVNATLVGFQAEGYNETRHSGKTTTHADVHERYVVYAVPEGNVMFPAAAGQVYPRTAILYKN
jgi:hypothetical protein